MDLHVYLKKKGIVQGAPDPGKNTSVSGCGAILTALKGLPAMEQASAQNIFGSAMHEQFLEDKSSYKVSKEEQEHIRACIKLLNRNTLVRSLMNGSTREKKMYKKLCGVLVAYILDIHKEDEKIGADLKTTSCRTLKQFIESAISYGYFRQAHVYIKCAGLKLFFFIGISKNYKKPEVFIFCANDHKDELKYAEQEMNFLLYFFSKYGKINPLTEWVK